MRDKDICLLFPGQASQYIGMGKALSRKFPKAAEYFHRADSALPFKISSICFYGPEDTLADTRFQQPAILTVSIAAFSVLKEILDLDIVLAAGHSLGEYSALVAAKSLEFEEALLLVAKRGELMQKASQNSAGGMAALLGKTTLDAKGLCEKASIGQDACYPANYNCPGQVVISGTKSALQRAKKSAKEFGVRRVIILPVSAPFHSPFMNNAAYEFAREINRVDIKEPKFDVYSNVTGLPHKKNPDDIRKGLIRQINSPVLFEDIIRHIHRSHSKGLTIECGPGKVLTGFIQRTAPKFQNGHFGEPDDLELIRRKIG